ncbi:hypothetical protein I4U23_031179 [Adineta vaga]|nr:hypothetical protein I4U23_031179 [Adineta vaga]
MGSCASVQAHETQDSTNKRPIKPHSHSPSPSSSSSKPIEHWLNPRYHRKDPTKIKKPDELISMMSYPPKSVDPERLDRILGSLIGLAVGDALGAHVEFRPRQYLVEHPVSDFQEGGTWGLSKGQFTDDTSMALCLAISLIICHGFSPYDQLVRYKWWYRHGYMSSTGQCFDIGAGTRQSINEFETRQKKFAKQLQLSVEQMDYSSDRELLEGFDVNCSNSEAAGNGGLMRLAPVPLFFHENPRKAVEYSGISGHITHGDQRAYDACRYYGALIVAALHGASKDELLDEKFYLKHRDWFGKKPLHEDVQKVAEGSFKKKNGYDDGIRGKGFVVNSLEAALWAFYIDEDSFQKGALAAVNLGDDTDTTAAIYGQLAGAYYGYQRLPSKWVRQVYAQDLIKCLSEWIVYEGQHWARQYRSSKHGSDCITKISSSEKEVHANESSKHASSSNGKKHSSNFSESYYDN